MMAVFKDLFAILAIFAAILSDYFVVKAVASPYNKEHQYAARLVQQLTGPGSGYNRTVMPPASLDSEYNASMSQPFSVLIRLFLVRIHEIVENQEALITTVRLQLGWIDPSLTWNPYQFGGIQAVILPAEKVWIPHLHLANNVEDSDILSADGYDVRVTYKGQVWYHPHRRISTRCALDLTFYPFDYQRCAIVVESAILTSKELVTKIRHDKPDPVSLGMYSENPLWHLIEANGFPVIYRSGHNTAFSRIHFWLIVKRKPNHFERTFLIPLILLSVLQVLTYLMPMHCMDRVPQSTVVMMTSFFLQGYISESLPRSSDGESYVQTYINLIIGLSVATVFICAITSELVQPDEGLRMWGIGALIRRHGCGKCRKVVKPNVDNDFVDNCVIASIYDNVVTPPVKPRRRRNVSGSSSKVKRATAIAAVVNWTGFALCASVSTLYPLFAFVIIIPRSPPPMPEPPVNAISTSYFAE